MTDHADTIRRALEIAALDDSGYGVVALKSFEVWEAERQQAIDERDAAYRETEAEKLQRDEWEMRALRAEARCEQAIDALRRIELWPFDVGSTDKRDLQRIKACARAALVSLGETE